MAVSMIAVLGVRAETLVVDKEKSRIAVDAKATGHAFTGVLDDFDVKVSGNGQSLAPTGVKLSWKFADLKTGDTDRDAAMLKWLGGGGPEGSFKFTKAWTDGGVTYAQGDLVIHGTTKTVAFPYKAKREGDKVTIDGTAQINYEDFGLPIVRAMLVMTVKPELVVTFHLVGSVR